MRCRHRRLAKELGRGPCAAAALVRQQARRLCISSRSTVDGLVLIETTVESVPCSACYANTNMSTAVWPPIDAAQLASAQAKSQQRELDWLLVQLKETLQSLKAGLEECAALLAPSEHGSTLVLTSVRSESLKGLVTRVGTRIVKGVR